jgi:hypothetical protein
MPQVVLLMLVTINDSFTYNIKLSQSSRFYIVRTFMFTKVFILSKENGNHIVAASHYNGENIEPCGP